MEDFQAKFINSIKHIDQQSWDSLANRHGPFLRHAFLAALESSSSVAPDTGWQPHHLTLYQKQKLVGIVPLYIKSHSYGEYVFDFSWANAFEKHGYRYYPKLLNAIPFTPVSGTRLLLAEHLAKKLTLASITDILKAQIEHLKLSSLHCLFTTEKQSRLLAQHQLLQRISVQFQWFNESYQDFNGFLDSLTARRRKSIKKERQKIRGANIRIKRLTGIDISERDLDFFYLCYRQTYFKRSGHQGYLNQAFFQQLWQSMPEQLMLVIAGTEQTAIASALYLFDSQQLCGRYWGTLQDIDGLHFECCYYQGIEFCIENSIASFNPGTQGEHKILRGFKPILCYSNHWLAESAFQQAVTDFLDRERVDILRYRQQAEQLLPFKRDA